MKRIFVCIGIFAVLVTFAAVCEFYVSDTVEQTAALLANAVESRKVGDNAASIEYADSAWEKWRELTKKSNFVLADLTIVSDVTVSLVRVSTLAHGDDSERFVEECAATIVMLEHFLADNQDVGDGVRAN